MMGENEDTQVDIISKDLKNISVALCVTGGIAAIESPKIARHLRRYGASVKAYVTKEALEFIGEKSLVWGTTNQIVKELSGKSEHICLEDIVLVAPATLNTTNKIFAGIADNPVTALVASALGKKIPVYLVPAMHDSLYNNPLFQKNIQNAEEYGITIIGPRISEGKAKLPKQDEIVKRIIKDLANYKTSTASSNYKGACNVQTT